MNKDLMLANMPPVFERMPSGGSVGNQGGWYYLYTHAFAADSKDKHIVSGYAKVMVRYSDDFCGGVDIRSVDVCATRTTRHTAYGWDRSFCGRTMKDYAALSKAAPWAKDVYRVPLDVLGERSGQRVAGLEDLLRTALALQILHFANSSCRYGIMGRDRQDGRVHEMIKSVATVSNWPEASFDKFTASDTRNMLKQTTTGAMGRVFKELPFWNTNSGNHVGVYAAVGDGDEITDENECYDDRPSGAKTRHVTLAASDVRAHAALDTGCPLSEWSCG
jgi:hypothetical protein